MTNIKLESYLAERKEIVEKALCYALSDGSIPETLRKAMQYSLMAGGKRLRPILVLAGAEAVGGTAEFVMPIACAIEMIHTFSLIHDDLPVMDNDDLRRGKPTNHKIFGEATAVLAGDALLAESFSILAQSVQKDNAHLVLDVIGDIASATGCRGMTGGQQVDMDSNRKKITEDQLCRLHALKTGRLITVSVTSGAKFSGATEIQLNALQSYGESLGLAFQIADDILDVEGIEEEIGKKVGSDVANEKATYPSTIGLEASKNKAKKLVDNAIASLAVFDEKADPLRQIAKYSLERKK